MQSFKFPWMQILAAGALVFIGFTAMRSFDVEINALTGIAIIAAAAVVAQLAVPRLSRG